MAFTIKVPNPTPGGDPPYVDANPEELVFALARAPRYFVLADYTRGDESGVVLSFEVFNRLCQGWYPLDALIRTDSGFEVAPFSVTLAGSEGELVKYRIPLGENAGGAALVLSPSDERIRIAVAEPDGSDPPTGTLVLRVAWDTAYAHPFQQGF